MLCMARLSNGPEHLLDCAAETTCAKFVLLESTVFQFLGASV